MRHVTTHSVRHAPIVPTNRWSVFPHVPGVVTSFLGVGDLPEMLDPSLTRWQRSGHEHHETRFLDPVAQRRGGEGTCPENRGRCLRNTSGRNRRSTPSPQRTEAHHRERFPRPGDSLPGKSPARHETRGQSCETHGSTPRRPVPGRMSGVGRGHSTLRPHTWHAFQYARSRVRVTGSNAFRAHPMRKPRPGEARRRRSSPDTVHGPGPGTISPARVRWWIRCGGALLHGFPRPAGGGRNGAEVTFRNRNRLPHTKPGRSRARDVGDECQTPRGTRPGRGAPTVERGTLPGRGHQERLCSRSRLRRSSSPVSSSNIALCCSGSLTGSVRWSLDFSPVIRRDRSAS